MLICANRPFGTLQPYAKAAQYFYALMPARLFGHGRSDIF